MCTDAPVVNDSPALRRLLLHLEEGMFDAVEGCYEIDLDRLLEVFQVDIFDGRGSYADAGVLCG